MHTTNPYFLYYSSNQVGRGVTFPYYRSSIRVQRGHGLFGNFLRSAWSVLRPLFTGAAKHVGAEALRQSSNVIGDVIDSPSQPLGDIVRRRGKEAVSNLTQTAIHKLKGGGMGKGGRVSKSNRRQPGSARAVLVKVGRGARKKKKGTTRPTRKTKRQIPSIRDIFAPPSPKRT